MGTTLTAAHVGERDVTIAHVGDSRCYRLRDGELERLTIDHTLVEELVRQGRLDAEEADEHPQRSVITRVLGPEALVEVDTLTFPARDGDVFLICSDGLTTMLSEETVAGVLRERASLRAAATRLVDSPTRPAGATTSRSCCSASRSSAAPAPWSTRRRSRSARSGGGRRRRRAPARATGPCGRSEARAASRSPRRAGGAAQSPRGPRAAGAAPRPRRRAALRVSAIVPARDPARRGRLATQAVYFVGADDQGFVTLYRGLPTTCRGVRALQATNYSRACRARRTRASGATAARPPAALAR